MIDFRQGDAERLPFADASFDGATFGVMFAANHARAHDYHRHHAVPAGLHVRREHLVVIGRRK